MILAVERYENHRVAPVLVSRAERVGAGLGADRLSAPAGDAAGYTLHYAGPEPQHAWTVDGEPVTPAPPVSPVPEAERGDPQALWQSAHRVVLTAAGGVDVICNGHRVPLTATA